MSPVITFAVPDKLVCFIKETVVDGALAAFVLGGHFFSKHFFYFTGSCIGNAYFFNLMIAAGAYKKQFGCIGIPFIIIITAA